MARRCRGFTLKAKTRASGAPYWLVSGTIAGKQEKQEFSSRADALAFLEKRNSQLVGKPAEQAPVVTRLSAEQVRDAEVAQQRLTEHQPTARLTRAVEYYRHLSKVVREAEAPAAGAAMAEVREHFPDVTWHDVCRFFVTQYRPPAERVSLVDAIERYISDVERRCVTGSLSVWQRKSIEFAMQRLEDYFTNYGRMPNFPLGEVSTGSLHEYLQLKLKGVLPEEPEKNRGRAARLRENEPRSFSNKAWNNNRGYLTRFFGFCQNRGWLVVNPATGLEKHGRDRLRRRGRPVILHANEARELMRYVEEQHEARLVPFVALALFAGIRPTWPDGEIDRLQPANFVWNKSVISLSAAETKTGRPREVTMRANLLAWLQAYPVGEFPIIPPNFRKLYAGLKKRFALGYDVLRHTYCSMLVGIDRSVANAALEAGNSENVLWSSYLDLVDEKEASEFWSIMPKSSAAERGMKGPRPQRKSRVKENRDDVLAGIRGGATVHR